MKNEANEECFMKKKNCNFVGFSIFILVIFGFIGCTNEQEYDVIFINQSSFTIQIDIDSRFPVNPMSFTISPGSTARGTTRFYGNIYFDWHRADTGNQTGVRFVDSRRNYGGTFYNH